jgi:tRNA-dihydrouridine synthase 4
MAKESLGIPVFANGNCKSYKEALEIARMTGADGVMVANGLLENPALFGGHPRTPRQCVEDWLDLEQTDNIPFDYFHHILIFMLKLVSKHQ